MVRGPGCGVRYYTLAYITAAALLLFGRSSLSFFSKSMLSCILAGESRLPEGYDVAELCSEAMHFRGTI